MWHSKHGGEGSQEPEVGGSPNRQRVVGRTSPAADHEELSLMLSELREITGVREMHGGLLKGSKSSVRYKKTITMGVASFAVPCSLREAFE